jgi:hypothetical protein
VLYQLSYLASGVDSEGRTKPEYNISIEDSQVTGGRAIERSLSANTKALSDEIRSPRGLSAGRVLAITAQFDLVSCLPAVIAAVLSVRPLRFDHALTGGVCALGSSGHIDLRPDSTLRLDPRARSSIQSGGLLDTLRRRGSGRSTQTENTRKAAD